jgi:acetyl esterase/lipase
MDPVHELQILNRNPTNPKRMAPRLPAWALCVGLVAVVAFACPAAGATSPAAPQVVPLWPDGSPNNPVGGPRPTMEIYHPFSSAVAATIVICPGGGYSGLSPYEKLFGEYFRGLGYTAVVVNYRVAPNRHPAPYADATRAIRLLRANAKEWKIPAARLALMGGSAGGHLAALVGTRPDFYQDPGDDLAATIPARPDRLILAYPVISAVNPSNKSRSFERLIGLDAPAALREALSAERHVDANTPPAFIFHAADDALVGVEQSLVFAQACWTAKVPAELHVFPRGGHGRLFAYAADVSPRWRALLQDWLAAWIAEPVSP